MSISRTPTLAEVLNAHRDAIFRDLRVSLPGRVEKYDASTQLADVQPLVKEQFTGDDGAPVVSRLPVITNVPIVFPGAGGFRITFPVAVGDTVLLVVADRSIDAWLSEGGETAPDDQRRHNLSDAYAIPGLHANNAAWTGAEAGVVTLGSDSGAADFVALATATKSALDSIISGFNTHIHAESGVNTAPPTTLLTINTSGVPSATVKVKG